MVAFAKSVCAGVNWVAGCFDESDRFVGQRDGERATRNYIPIGTGTVFKMGVACTTALVVLFAQKFITGCYSSEAQSKLTCHVISDAFDYLKYADFFNTIFLFYRLDRNVND